MTNKEITNLVKRTVSNTLTEFFSDPDFGKTVKKSFLKSIEKARSEKGRSLTITQFRREYGY